MTDLNFDARASETKPQFKGEVLKKIYRVWLVRRFFPVLAAEVVVLALFLYWLGRLIFVEQIIDNGVKVFLLKPGSIISFTISAFLHAALLTKLITLGVAILAAFLIRHLTQGLLRYILVKENYFSKTDSVSR